MTQAIDDDEYTIPLDELDIEVVDKPAQQADVSKAEDDPFEALKKQFETATKEKEALEQRFQEVNTQRQQFEQQASTSQTQYVQTQKALIEQAIATKEVEAETAERALAQAYAAQDWTAAAKHQRELTQIDQHLMQYQTGLVQVDDVITKLSKPTATQANQAADPIEHHISQFSPRAQEWLRSHKDDVYKSEARGQLAYAGHIVAVNKGLQPDTDEYFEFLDTHMGYVDDAAEDNTESKPAPKRRPIPSAPPSRGNNATSTKVHLSAEEKEIADALEMTYEAYAKNKLAIQEGRTNMRP